MENSRKSAFEFRARLAIGARWKMSLMTNDDDFFSTMNKFSCVALLVVVKLFISVRNLSCNRCDFALIKASEVTKVDKIWISSMAPVVV